MSLNTWTHLYIIQHPDEYFKIGRAEDPDRRRSGIQTGSPYDLELVYDLKYMKPSGILGGTDLESEVHESLQGYNVRGEWFDCSLVEILHHIAICVREWDGTVSPSGWSA